MSSRLLSAGFIAALSVSLAACSGGGASDSVDASGGNGSASTTLNLYAYSAPKEAFGKLIPAFEKTEDGKGVAIKDSYGPSGDQSRAVAAGAPADVVNFSLDPDVTKLVDAGKVAEDWNAGDSKGEAFGSVVSIVVRGGNPKKINTWDDLLKPGVEVVTPNPLSSGAAKWNLLAPFAALSDGGKNSEAGLNYVSTLVKDHIKTQPKSARDASEAFLQGTGDALITYENEALFLEGQGEKVEHIIPAQTLKIENPIAVVKTSKNAALAQKFVDFVWSDEGQQLVADAGFRPVNAAVFDKNKAKFPAPSEKLWTIADLGGWKSVNDTFFDADKGSITKIYDGVGK